MLKGVRFRIYPNKEQQTLIVQTFGCCRLVYNQGLDLRVKNYEAGIVSNYNETSKMLTILKQQEDHAFLKDVDSIALQQSLRDLDRAYTNFFQHRAGFPKFRSKHDHFQSYRTINQNNNIRIEDKKLKLPKIGLVKIKQSMEIGHIKNVTIEKTPTNKYFAVLVVEFEPKEKPSTGAVIGIDVGIKDFYTDSNGHTVQNPRFLEKAEHKLHREQRKLSRRKKGSNNYEKQRKRVALVYEKTTNSRTDFLQKLSTSLIDENQTICVENLKVKNMVKNHKLAKHISSVSWSKFFEYLTYKANWYNRDLIKVETFYPSSQTCSCCGCKNPDVKNLAVREWECPVCHTCHDRDKNAALNILNKGLLKLTA